MKPECKHEFAHIETKKWSDSSGGYQIQWVRVERFFCTKCLHQEDKKREEWSRDTPEWYK